MPGVPSALCDFPDRGEIVCVLKMRTRQAWDSRDPCLGSH